MTLSVTAKTQHSGLAQNSGPSAAPKSGAQSQVDVDHIATATRRNKGKGKAPLQGPPAPQSSLHGVQASGSKARGPAPAMVPQTAPTPEADAGAALSAVSEIKSENGELTFVLTIPAAIAGQPDQRFRISILGGEQADLAGLNRSELAKHLTQAITLVQNNLQMKDFSAITFEGRLGDDALAKAVVHTKTGKQILGGTREERVTGTEKIFSDELEELLKRLQKTLAVRTSKVKISRMPDAPVPAAPPSTPMTETFADSDGENDIFHDAPEIAESVWPKHESK